MIDAVFDIPHNRLLPVHEIDIHLIDSPHPYEIANRDAIDAHWERELARQPKLFDGEVILLAEASYRDGVITGSCHPIRFATFMHWRANKSTSGGFHVFASAMPVTGDNALVAIRMGPQTANAGRVYFAAGSFERQDFTDMVADVGSNIHREVEEETGIDLRAARRDRSYIAYCTAAGLTLIRRYYLDDMAADIEAAVRAFIAGQAEPEADRVVIIRSGDDVPVSAPAHMKPLVDWHYNGDGQGRLEN